MKSNDLFTEEKKNEMLELRMKGYSYPQLAQKYGVHDTTIIYHCKHAGITLKEEEKNCILKMSKEGMSNIDISLKIGVAVSVVEFYISRYNEYGVVKTHTPNCPLVREVLKPVGDDNRIKTEIHRQTPKTARCFFVANL